MKLETTASFDSDFAGFSKTERDLFVGALRVFVPAFDRYAEDPAAKWPAALRIKALEGAPGVWEMTWSFSGPDGRATFEWTRIDGRFGLRWRRVGGHAIFRKP